MYIHMPCGDKQLKVELCMSIGQSFDIVWPFLLFHLLMYLFVTSTDSWGTALQPLLYWWCNSNAKNAHWRCHRIWRWYTCHWIPGNSPQRLPTLLLTWCLAISVIGADTDVDFYFQMGKDVVTFLSWAAEPEMEERKLVTRLFTFLMFLSFMISTYKRHSTNL